MKKYVLPAIVFGLATLLALYNIGNFPKMVGDEGIYVSQAYWLAHFGKLGPYTYWYDHSPLGWAQIGLWQLLTGATGFLNYTVLSGRVFIGIILGGTTTLLYLLTHKLTKSKLASFMASTIYITSALTLTFGRMVLLDNLAIFWLLLSALLLFDSPTKLKNLIFSALALSFAILSKESLLFFLIPYIFSVYQQNENNPHKKYALLVNFTTIFFVLGFFPLLAILKGELFAKTGQVSFLGTLLFQASRGSGTSFWQLGSHFRQMIGVWTSIDPILILLGAGSTVIIPFLPLTIPQKSISIFSLFFLLFLIRGGQIYDFYIIPLLPLFALNISILLHHFQSILKTKILSIILLISTLGYFVFGSTYPLTSNATLSQKQSIDALKELPSGSTIVATNYAYLDIYLQNKNTIHWYQKIESDQTIQNLSPNITHMLIDEQFNRELEDGQLPFLNIQLSKQSTLSKFGRQLSPGEQIKPYTSEFLTLYQTKKGTQLIQNIISLATIEPEQINQLKSKSPYAVLVTRANFTNSTDLQSYISILKSSLSPDTLIVISQDDTGINSIPWITTPSRSFYKSEEEATVASTKKSQALKELGFTGAIITSSSNTDGYLNTIMQAAKPLLTPLVRFVGDVPTYPSILVTETDAETATLKHANYTGQIIQLTNAKDYLGESN